VKYDEVKNGFFTQKCDDLKDSTFDIYYEVPPTPEYFKEQTYNLAKEGGDAPDRGDYEYVKSNSPFINDTDRHTITEVTFANGKATTRTPLDKDVEGIMFEHDPVRIRKQTRPIRHISRRRGRRGHRHGDGSSRKRRGCPIADLVARVCADGDSSDSSDNSRSSDSLDVRETHKRSRRDRLLHGKPTKGHGMAKAARDGIYV